MPYFSSRPQTVAAWSFYLLTVTLVAAGCGKKSTNGHVAGRVTLVGNPLSKGSVMFQNPESGVTLVAGIQSDGAYQVKSYKEDGVPPGTYQVAVQPQSPTTKRPQFVARPTQQRTPAKPSIPTKYQNIATSGLKVTVQPSGNPSFDFDLKP